MTETKLPEELEEQAMLYAFGVMDPEDRLAFELRLEGESTLLRQTTAAYQAIIHVLSTVVVSVTPPSTLRERLVQQVAKDAAREVEHFELAANTVALGSTPVKPQDLVRERLLSRIQAHSAVRLAVNESLPVFRDIASQTSDERVSEERMSVSHGATSLSMWLYSCWAAGSNFLKTLLICSMIPRPSSNGLTFVKASEGTWRGIAQGVTAKLLAFDPVSRRTTTLLRFLPGTSYAPHRHTAVEELYVLEGGCSIAGREMAVGDYHRAEAGTVHHDTSTEEGCLLLVISSPQNELLR
ncbi:MAG TPA: cupin domain-containing protein [Nitrospira sp.]|nr:cupin domain-containing protein [Nitrospira sp.]